MRGTKARKIRKMIRQSISESDQKAYLESLEEENKTLREVIRKTSEKNEQEVTDDMPAIVKEQIENE